MGVYYTIENGSGYSQRRLSTTAVVELVPNKAEYQKGRTSPHYHLAVHITMEA